METCEKKGLRNICRVSTNYKEDTFVGIKSNGNDISVNFPVGYCLPDDENELRKEILTLLSVLSKYKDPERLMPDPMIQNPENVDFPIQAYLFLINNFIQSGYYRENEVRYNSSCKGKINWSRTIKQKKPMLQGNEAIYIDFISKENVCNDNNLITLVHEFCVYESFQKLGWLYSSFIPKTPRLTKLDSRIFSTVIYEKLSQTFNERTKELFNSMLALINYLGETNSVRNFCLGTNDFHNVWEKLIDFTYGVLDKSEYYPKTFWTLTDKAKPYKNSNLLPDTIIVHEDKIFVIDAKYYKYGVTKVPSHLPGSVDINKQISYGEYIANKESFVGVPVYNAFVMPFDKTNLELFPKVKDHVLSVGEATADWKVSNKEYERVQGILVDIKKLMHNSIRKNLNEISRLTTEIESSAKC